VTIFEQGDGGGGKNGRGFGGRSGVGPLRLIRFGGQLDYAAFLAVKIASNSAGLT